MNNLLLIDDNVHQLNFLKQQLAENFAIDTSESAIEALSKCKNKSYDAIVVDLHMPIINGLDFIREFRKSNTDFRNLFILSSENSDATRISALNLGVRDFLWPEMNKEELILRIGNTIGDSRPLLTYRDIKIDLSNLFVYLGEEKIETTLIEFKLIRALVLNATRIVSREEVRNQVWPGQYVLDKTLNTHLTNLRGKLGDRFEIKSIKNEGIVLI